MNAQLHPYLEHFRIRHAQILASLADFLRLKDNQFSYFTCCQKILDPFLKQEEQTLFLAISAKANITAGGPLCMLYYEQHQNSPSILRAESICGITIPKPSPETVDEAQWSFFEVNSPVCIPILDHIACSNIVKSALPLLNRSIGPKSASTLLHLATIHFDILKLNFEKKDNCLLPMSQQLLSEEEMNAFVLKLRLPDNSPPLKHRI